MTVQRKRRLIVFALICILSIGAALYADAPATTPNVPFALIQLEISRSLVSSGATFETKLEELIEHTVDRSIRSGQRVELIVFPEYTSVFLSLAHVAGFAVAEAEHISDLYALLDATDPPTGSSGDKPIAPALNLAYAVAQRGNEKVDRFWAEIASRYEIDVIAGTYFAIDSVSGRLRNRTIVYSRDGTLLYSQDKVFLTPFELDIIGLSPGFVGNARTFTVQGHKVAVTICRDSFFDVWERGFSQATLWFDIKANGAEYTDEEARLFQTALPERIGSSGVPLGGTACLTGSLFDLFWEGESSIVAYDENEGFRYAGTAGSHDRESVVLYELSDPAED